MEAGEVNRNCAWIFKKHSSNNHLKKDQPKTEKTKEKTTLFQRDYETSVYTFSFTLSY